VSVKKAEKRSPHLVPLLVLLCITAAVYFRTLDDNFLLNWDDGFYVVFNETIRGFVFSHLKQAFSSIYVGNYAPIQMLSYMLDYTLWGLRPAGFIATNILLHFLSGTLYYFLLVRLTGRKLVGFVATFIFLFHPVQVESVAWISQRKNVLAMVFFLTAFHLYVTYSNKSGQPGRIGWYCGCFLVFVLALMTKPVAIVFIPTLLLFDYCFAPKGLQGRNFLDKIPFIIAGGLLGLVAVASQSTDTGGLATWHGGTPLNNILNMLVVFKEYLLLLSWPAHLSGLYLLPIKTGIDREVVFAALLVLVIAGIGLYMWRRGSSLLFWGGVFVAGLLPVAQIVPLVTLMNDRYLYFPMLGAAALASIAATDFLVRMQRWRLAAIIPLVLLLMVLPWLSWQRTAVWHDDVSFWSDTAAKTSNAPESWYSLGISYEAIGRLDQALGPFLRTLALEPEHDRVMGNLLNVYNPGGSREEIRGFFLELAKHYSIAHNQFFLLGHDSVPWHYREQAESLFARLAMINPHSPDDFAALGNLSLERGEAESARYSFQRAQQEGLPEWQVLYDLACLEVISDGADRAMELLYKAVAKGFPYRDTLEHDPFLKPLTVRQDFRQLIDGIPGERK
jgi:hypothetical protein